MRLVNWILNVALVCTVIAAGHAVYLQASHTQLFREWRLVGTRVEVPGLPLTDRTYVIALSERCPASLESIPFIRTLTSHATQRGIPVAVVMPSSEPSIARFVDENAIHADHYASVKLTRLSVMAVPAVLALGREGRVSAAWFGVAGRELDILETLTQ